MGCKHEGGTDPCEVYTSNGACKVAAREYYINNREKVLRAKADALVRRGRNGSQNHTTGYTNELLAAADLNCRCGSVGGWAYLNPLHSSADDAFAKTSLGWRTVQIKTAGLKLRRDGTVAMHLNNRRGGITSEIIALVDDRNMKIRYIANDGSTLPPELPDKPTPICKGVILLNNPEEL